MTHLISFLSQFKNFNYYFFLFSVNWCQNWFEFYPFPPINTLAMIENILAYHDPELLEFYYKESVTSSLYACTLLQTVLSEVRINFLGNFLFLFIFVILFSGSFKKRMAETLGSRDIKRTFVSFNGDCGL